MKLSKIAMASALAMTLAAFGAQAANQGQGTVNFKGSVIDSPCGIAPESADQSIDFGQLSKAHLAADGVSASKALDIKLVNCVLQAAPAKNVVKVAFTGATNGSHLDELGTAGNTGTAIVVSEQGASTGMQFDGTAGAGVKFGPSQTLHYSTWVKKATGQTVTEGDFSAVVNFNLTYE